MGRAIQLKLHLRVVKLNHTHFRIPSSPAQNKDGLELANFGKWGQMGVRLRPKTYFQMA